MPLVLGSIALLHFLLFKEYIRQDKIQTKRLKEMESLVQTEILRSKGLNSQVGKLTEIKEKTQQQLDLIKLQVQSIKADEGNPKKKTR
ncbi:hypothetical protein PBT90_16290 [Algoriphagus halophytocola]|uniref:hypothetical protein n=1 Tax=Algoriphagus halophytocola TaxID=2991499 RepID=UPI0022DD5337|nr:hypothetical protein [Algoriphagus sp. TR-M9]WBL42296.1 hypothetical protein PBT90_16290 [Algoriphagus sp. TR-M9]